MHLGRNAKATHTLFNLATNSNTLLQTTIEQKDLGVWITPSMIFSVHCCKSAGKANQALGMIKHNFKYISKSSLMIYTIQNICSTTSQILRSYLEFPLLQRYRHNGKGAEKSH